MCLTFIFRDISKFPYHGVLLLWPNAYIKRKSIYLKSVIDCISGITVDVTAKIKMHNALGMFSKTETQGLYLITQCLYVIQTENLQQCKIYFPIDVKNIGYFFRFFVFFPYTCRDITKKRKAFWLYFYRCTVTRECTELLSNWQHATSVIDNMKLQAASNICP